MQLENPKRTLGELKFTASAFQRYSIHSQVLRQLSKDVFVFIEDHRNGGSNRNNYPSDVLNIVRKIDDEKLTGCEAASRYIRECCSLAELPYLELPDSFRSMYLE